MTPKTTLYISLLPPLSSFSWLTPPSPTAPSIQWNMQPTLFLIPVEWSKEWIPGPPEENTSLLLNGLLPLVLLVVLFSMPNKPELFWVSIADTIPVWPRVELILVWNGGMLDPMVPPIPDWEKPDGDTKDRDTSQTCIYNLLSICNILDMNNYSWQSELHSLLIMLLQAISYKTVPQQCVASQDICFFFFLSFQLFVGNKSKHSKIVPFCILKTPTCLA